MSAIARGFAYAAVALASIALISAFSEPADAAQARTYYVAADEILWNYLPLGGDVVTGRPLAPLPGRIGHVFHKLVYREYTDGTFARLTPRDAYLGIAGPVLHAEVGDTIVVHFKNRTHLPVDMEPEGGVSGAPARPIAPGTVTTYRWSVGDAAGPGPMDASSTVWQYFSNGAHPGAGVMAGLEGAIVVTRAGDARPDGSPADVDHEVFAWFEENREEQSALWPENVADPRTNPGKVKGSFNDLLIPNIFVTINGFTGGDGPPIVVKRGERVRWYVYDGNSDGDGHIPTWNGNTLVWQGHRVDSVFLGFTQAAVADMVPDNVGTWMLYCTLNIHLENGMVARYRVVP